MENSNGKKATKSKRTDEKEGKVLNTFKGFFFFLNEGDVLINKAVPNNWNYCIGRGLSPLNVELLELIQFNGNPMRDNTTDS